MSGSSGKRTTKKFVPHPPPTGRWTASSSYDIYMVHTPKESNGNKATEDNPLEKQSKHRRHRRRSKPRHSKSSDIGTRDNNAADSSEDEDSPLQPCFEQEDGKASPKEQATDGESGDDNYMPLSKDEVSSATKNSSCLRIPSSRSASSAGLWPQQIA